MTHTPESLRARLDAPRGSGMTVRAWSTAEVVQVRCLHCDWEVSPSKSAHRSARNHAAKNPGHRTVVDTERTRCYEAPR